MSIEYQNQEIVVRIANTVNRTALQKALTMLSALETISQNKGTEEDAAQLAREVEANWWQQNKHRFLS